MTTKIPCSVEVLTLNSEKTLEKCLESVKDFDDIIVLDGNSTDQTISIAQKYGARVCPQKETPKKNVRIDDFSEVRNKGIKLVRYQWFTFIDSDEYLSSEAVEEIREIVAKGDRNEYFAFRRPRKYVLNGKIIERSAVYPNYQIRLFYIPVTLGFIKKVHETIKLKVGIEISNLKYPEYVPLAPIDVVNKKWNRYLDIQQELLRGLTFGRLIRGIRANISKATKYAVKYCWVLVTQRGERMPIAYEFHNVTYHLKLIVRLIENYYLKLRRKTS